MRRRTRVCALGLAVVAAAAGSATAGPGLSGGRGCNGSVQSVGGVFYVEKRGGVWTAEVWVYMESNGIKGLQSGGESPLLDPVLDYRDDCAHDNPDTLLF